MIGKPCPTRCVTVTWSLMISSSPWAKTRGLLPGTATKPGSAPPLLMSKAKYLAVRAALALLAGWTLRAVVAGVFGAAAATPIVPHAASAAPAAIIVALRAGLCIADLLDARFLLPCHQTTAEGSGRSGPALIPHRGMPWTTVRSSKDSSRVGGGEHDGRHGDRPAHRGIAAGRNPAGPGGRAGRPGRAGAVVPALAGQRPAAPPRLRAPVGRRICRRAARARAARRALRAQGAQRGAAGWRPDRLVPRRSRRPRRNAELGRPEYRVLDFPGRTVTAGVLGPAPGARDRHSSRRR